MRTPCWTFGLYVLLFGCITNGQVIRDFTTDKFYESEEFKCHDKIRSYQKQTGLCSCEEGKTFFYHKQKNCHTREDIINLAGKCNEGFITMDTKSVQIMNSCQLKEMTRIDIWDYENKTGYWRPDNTDELRQDLSVKNGEYGIKIDPRNGNWDGLLVKLTFQCEEAKNMRRCMLVKLTGQREYPLRSKRLTPETTTQMVIPDDNEPTAPTKTTTKTVSTPSNLETSKTSVTTETQKMLVNNTATTPCSGNCTQTVLSVQSTEYHSTVATSSNTVLTKNSNKKSYLNVNQSSGITAKITICVTLTVVLSIVIISFVVFIRHKIATYQNNHSDIEQNNVENIIAEQNTFINNQITLTKENDWHL